MVSGTRSLCSTSQLLVEGLERKLLSFLLTNECWKLFSENYEES